jgi:hypothetical protein
MKETLKFEELEGLINKTEACIFNFKANEQSFKKIFEECEYKILKDLDKFISEKNRKKMIKDEKKRK